MKPATFVFERYQVDERQLEFNYSYLDSDQVTLGRFSETYQLPTEINPDDPVTQYLLQQLHIIVGISYYKSLLGEIELPYKLDATESDYWNTVYNEGLGEFAYLNQLSHPIKPFQTTVDTNRQATKLVTSGAILGVGGGKDSAVSGELFKRLGVETHTMDIATRDNHGQAGAVMDVMGLDQLRVERYLDTGIVDFTNQHQGYNGHIPLSAILAWFGTLLAYSLGKRYIIMANEAATSSGNVTWNSRLVNHQWSKSFEFEQRTQQFIHSHISEDLWYFSPIRPYSSLAVIELFAKWNTAYFDTFTSCNLVLRIDKAKRPNGRWCTRCAKCLSTWLLLSVWIDASRLEEIFGRNLLEDTSLQPILRELLGLEGHKPLDCVGTVEELRAAARQALNRYPDKPLLNGLDPAGIPGPEIQAMVKAVGPHNIPAEVSAKLLAIVAQELG